ncbi:MAG TPA: nuclear transport factor 2 family protein, partial [Kiloniellales bacterium]|nr:nuclear transport factor 2 family protein [Kiloniellales bacterium]
KGQIVDEWLELLEDEVDFQSIADDLPLAPFAKPYKTREEVRQYLGGLIGEWEMIHYTVDRFVEQGDDVVMIGHTSWRNRRTGKVVDTRKVDLWQFKGDKVVSFYEMLDTWKIASCCMPD